MYSVRALLGVGARRVAEVHKLYEMEGEER